MSSAFLCFFFFLLHWVSDVYVRSSRILFLSLSLLPFLRASLDSAMFVWWLVHVLVRAFFVHVCSMVTLSSVLVFVSHGVVQPLSLSCVRVVPVSRPLHSPPRSLHPSPVCSPMPVADLLLFCFRSIP